MWKVVLVSLMVFGCGPGAPPAEAPSGPIELTAEGTNLNPPVQVAQIPDGGWYCDMGTVHYARADKGDGKCPRCNMDLVHKGADKNSKSGGKAGH